MLKHKVVFFSPGTFFAETTEKEIDSWDVDTAKQMARTIKERHGATPYGFRFETWERGQNDWEPKRTKVSGTYFLGGKILALEDIPNTPENKILRSNMTLNNWDYVIENTNSWKIVLPYEKNDVLLEF